MKHGINIGHDPETVLEFRAAILEILSSGVEQKTMRCALKVLRSGMKIDNTYISGCTVINGEREEES